MNSADIVIIGGGAAGLMAAAKCAGSGKKVILLEKNRECGKKLLITGKGRCNITNFSPWEDFQTHIHPDRDFFRTSFYNFSNHAVIDFFEKTGLTTMVERGNRVYPSSQRSADVRDTFLKVIRGDKDIEVLTSIEVASLTKDEEGMFRICAIRNGVQMDTLSFICRKVILATGGLSYPLTGSTGDGLRFAQDMGHSLEETFPSLTALKPAKRDARLDGLTLRNVKLDLFVNGSMVQSEFGELSFTDGGIEGALGFRVSRKGVHALIHGQKVEVSIDLKPALDTKQIADRITREVSEYKKIPNIKTLLKLMLPGQLIDPFIEAQSTPLTLQNIPVRLKEWRIKIVGYVGYERAVITAGGVSLDEISRKSMESKLIGGLYFAGEVVNLDADTGGYNLQVAFSTGALAAASAIKSLNSI